MSSAAPFMLRLLSASVCAANRSSAIIREVLQKGSLEIIDKGVNDPQTEADRRAQRCIVATLQHRFPGINVIGEEADVITDENDSLLVKIDEEIDEILKENCPQDLSHLTQQDVVVWVDPLDGTREYTEGFVEHVTVLIGISYRSRPVGGVINQPFYGPNGRTIWGVPGLGVKGMTCTSAGSPSDKLDRPLNIAVTRSHMNQLLQETMDAIKPAEILRVGGSGHKILLVLEGKADAYVYTCLGTKRWDTCAGEAIVLAAGGKLTDSLGELISYDPHAKDMMNYKGVVVTMRCHDDLISMIPEKVKTKL